MQEGPGLAMERALPLLRAAEERYGVQVLFAVESGSRAWGFPSPDSDFDIRFVYRHELPWYLSLSEERDTIEQFEGAELDAGGWEVRKVLRQLKRSNAVCWEWLQSPIVYAEAEPRSTFIAAARPFFSPRAAWHHYRSQLKRLAGSFAVGEDARLKDMLYALRSALAAKWIDERQTPPPMTLGELLLPDLPPELLRLSHDLVDQKRLADEKARALPDTLLLDLVQEILARDERCRDSLPVGQGREEDLDALLMRLVVR